MIPVEAAIYRVRRDITLSMLLKGMLMAAVFACVVFAHPSIRFAALAGVVAVWIALSVTSARSSRLGVDSPGLIAMGKFDEAERQIDLAMRAFSLFGSAKLRALHQLAVLRHAQRRWREAAVLCRALLKHRLGMSRSLAKPARLILAESLLELSDLPGSQAVVQELNSLPLSLEESLNVLSLQLNYEARIGAWDRMFFSAPAKVQLAELMPSAAAARVQALLALAAANLKRNDWALWLRRRAELLVDVNQLVQERPLLGQVWGIGDVIAGVGNKER